MTTKLFSLTFTIFLLVLQPLFLLGQNVSKQEDWTAVQALSAGTRLAIETKDGKKFKGDLNSVSATTITLTGNNNPTNLNKDEIKRIFQLRGGSRAKSAIIGTAVGAGAGAGAAGIALGATGGSDETTAILAKGILIGAGIGAVVGILLGKDGKRVLIYESK